MTTLIICSLKDSIKYSDCLVCYFSFFLFFVFSANGPLCKKDRLTYTLYFQLITRLGEDDVEEMNGNETE